MTTLSVACVGAFIFAISVLVFECLCARWFMLYQRRLENHDAQLDALNAAVLDDDADLDDLASPVLTYHVWNNMVYAIDVTDMHAPFVAHVAPLQVAVRGH